MLGRKEDPMRISLLLVTAGLVAGCDGDKPAIPDAPPGSDASVADAAIADSPPPVDGAPVDSPPASSMFSFFVTSAGNPKGGDFRRSATDTDGLAGADEFCRALAARSVPASASRPWRAYLSTDNVDARDRIGQGPWFNHAGVMIAASLTELHEQAATLISKTTALDEAGRVVPGRGDTPNQHDILTGSEADGTASSDHCSNWTSSSTAFRGTVGHSDRMGTGTNAASMSWNASHTSQGCAFDSFPPTGGRGSIYCFAAD
jgi:hypothetical protein